ncbi:hypothetical protein HDV00_010982 [Rhizophlyctis rosea]|nr:hypothetical protein HDV00_010982 [Rhizophlyctis rosea]
MLLNICTITPTRHIRPPTFTISSVSRIFSTAPTLPPRKTSTLCLSNLNFSTRAEDLRTYLKHYGRILDCRLLTDKKTGASRGIAFVELEDPQVAQTILREMHGKEFQGRRVRVVEGDEKPMPRTPPPQPATWRSDGRKF